MNVNESIKQALRGAVKIGQISEEEAVEIASKPELLEAFADWSTIDPYDAYNEREDVVRG